MIMAAGLRSICRVSMPLYPLVRYPMLLGLRSSTSTVAVKQMNTCRHISVVQKWMFPWSCQINPQTSRLHQLRLHFNDFRQNLSRTRMFSSLHCCLRQRSDRTLQSDVEHIEKELEAEKNFAHGKKKQSSTRNLKNSMTNVGKFVPDKILQLKDVDGTLLGTVNRHQAVALSQEKKLKLVLLKPNAKPWPLYKLMTGQELHQEQLKRNEKLKKKTAATQVKEIKASWNIGQHDIDVRRRHIEDWFSDETANIHVRVTVTGGRGADIVPQEKQMDVVRQLMVGSEDKLTLNGPPKMTGRNQSTLTVTMRMMSAKEKTAYQKDLEDKATLRKTTDTVSDESS